MHKTEEAEELLIYSALVGVEYGTGNGNHEIEVTMKSENSEKREKLKIPVQAGTFPSEKLQVPPRTVEPSAKDKIKIERDQKVIAEVYRRRTLEKLWDPPAVMPVQSIVTSEFGTFRVYNGKKLNAHLGTDLRAPTGEKIRAPIRGKVALARYLFYTGYTVILDHGYGFFTIYGHLSKLQTREGKMLKKGQVLGLSGSTGRASGPHLHWGVNLHGTKIDPMGLMKLLAQEDAAKKEINHSVSGTKKN